MNDTNIDRETMGRRAKALAFISSPQDAIVLALKRGEETGSAKDIRTARALFMQLRPADRRSALATLSD
jgi:hypothetical protein